MYLSINNISESVKNPSGLFATLAGIYAICDKAGEPILATHDRSVEFLVNYNKQEYTLSCLFGADCDSQRLRDVSMLTRLSESPFLSPYIYLENELTVFDNNDTPHQIDVVLSRRPEGKTLREVIEQLHTQSGNYVPLLMQGLSSLAGWMCEHNFAHGHITLNNIIISPSLQPVLINYGSKLGSPLRADIAALAKFTAILYTAACAPESFERFTTNHAINSENIAAYVGLFSDVCDKQPFLREVMNAVNGGADVPAICKALADLAATQPQFCDRVSQNIDRIHGATPAVKNAAQVQEKLARYKFVGEMQDMMIRVFDGERWHFLNKNGEKVISGDFLNADDFSEGRAVVEVASGFGLIDSHGNFVVEPLYDDIEWDADDNVAIVTKDGMSGLISRTGEQITGLIYDIILKPSEELLAAKKNGLFGYIRKSGSTAIGFMFDDAFGFENGIARVKLKGRDILIDRDGNQIA